MIYLSKAFNINKLLELGFTKNTLSANNWSEDIYSKDAWVPIDKNRNNLYRVTIRHCSSIPSVVIGRTAYGVDVVECEQYDKSSPKVVYGQPYATVSNITGDICDQGCYGVYGKEAVKVLKFMGVEASE